MTTEKPQCGSQNLQPAIHPGQFVRERCLEPRRLTVLAAAKLVGVGRPAFSNFLNGNAAATPEMASRIEVAFGVRQEELLALQSTFDAATAKAKGAPTDATPYVAPFLGVKARDIEAWAERSIPARSRLAVFLRTLVNSTGRCVTQIDFPGNDDAERPGWDGRLEATQGTPWIPEGISGWEFGTNQDPKAKADSDFAKSVKAHPQSEREHITFVFVTPRHWPGKEDWVKAQQAKRRWRDVRAYDSSDLEQWLELSIAGQTWFAHETGKPSRGVRTLDQCWLDWAEVTEPALPPSLFSAPIEAAQRVLLSRFEKNPDGPIIVTADSTEEALAFLAQFIEAVDDPRVAAVRDRILVFDEPGVVKELARGTTGFVPVAHSREVERELAPLMQTLHCIVVYPRNAPGVEPHVVLEPLSQETFRKPLEAIGFSRDRIAQLEEESGRSLTILRRRLAIAPAVRTPQWATEPNTAASLVPYLWAGAWSATMAADQTILTLLAEEKSYEPLEKQCQRLAQLNDPPVWSVGHFRGVSSKIDLLFAVAPHVTRAEIDRFYKVADLVLKEDDPKLDLPDDQRWAAGIHGKSREISSTLRQSIAETLVLLSVYGTHLFSERLGFDCDVASRNIVRSLLTPLSTRLLEANDSDLTAYAEAAPEEFLSIIEADLRSDAPATYGLMRPAGTGFGSSCPRTGLLWALEGLAWNPATMPRATRILAQLAQIEITDNWMNRPINSLDAIFRSWMPQTAANHEVRIKVIDQLAEQFPSVAWRVCIAQLATGSRIGGYSHKPKWRNDGHGFGEPLRMREPVVAFIRDMIGMALNWRHGYTREMLCDLVDCLAGFTSEHRERVWEIVGTWAVNASDADRVIVREHIRKRLLSRRGKRAAEGTDAVALTKAANNARELLEPTDLIKKHEWLFREQWVEESAEELSDDAYDYEKREERISTLRADALRATYEARGLNGILELATLGNASHVIGYLLSRRLFGTSEVVDSICHALSTATDEGKCRQLIAGYITGQSDESAQTRLIDALTAKLPGNDLVRVLLSAPFRRHTWHRVDALGEEAQQAYWRNVSPVWIRDDLDESGEGVTRLLSAKRPRAAFYSVHLSIKKLEPELLFRLLTDVAKGGDEPEGHYRLSAHNIEEAFERIDGSPALTIEQKAGLEYAYLEALAKPSERGGKYGVPNLERYIEDHPDLFVQALVWTYRRKDGGTDPLEYAVAEGDRSRAAEKSHRLLKGLQAVPGHDEHGNLSGKKLVAWINAVRNACRGLGRLEVADVCIGELLANAPADADGVWPCEAVRDALEEVHSADMMHGAHIGLFNSRGVFSRGEGGAQERAIADTYRVWADALQYTHPFVSSELLMEMVRTYEHDAQREDTVAKINRRLR